MAFVSACSNDDDVTAYQDALEIKGVQAIIDNEVPTTRSASEKTETAVGRTTFITGDHIVFTTIKRTESPLASFTYSDIRYYYTDKKSWKRTEGNLPEKIYWTDGASAHTFIGYSLPAEDYHWVDNGNGTYSGELGYEKEVIDFTAGNDEIQKEDLLLDYNTKTVAETGGLSTKVSFTHALSCVRVEVNISNFASSASAVDTKVGVSNMILLNQPTKFTWGGNSNKLKVLDFEDQTTKNIKLWCPVPAGEGTGQSKTFTFYGLTTPQDDTFHNINGNDLPLMFSFTVTYPNPLNPDETLTKTYKGSFSQLVNFHSGMCTTLNISLNHKDEQMYMGVEYNDWNYVATPDLGELRKKSTFMDINSTVTIHTDDEATVYDATWLYLDGTQLKDIYGNDGTPANPYRITSASQLLSFAKEVKAGVDFKDKFIRLDADITMQASTAKTSARTLPPMSSPLSGLVSVMPTTLSMVPSLVATVISTASMAVRCLSSWASLPLSNSCISHPLAPLLAAAPWPMLMLAPLGAVRLSMMSIPQTIPLAVRWWEATAALSMPVTLLASLAPPRLLAPTTAVRPSAAISPPTLPLWMNPILRSWLIR